MSTHGLRYPDDFLSALPVLLPRPAPHAPIRALTAAQFAKIRQLHLTSDVPDSVLFPFLHGIEGENHAQNLFFSKHGSRVDAPDYRGLVWVICDDDDVLPLDKQGEHDREDLEDEHPPARDPELPAENAAGGVHAAHDRRRSDASSHSSSVESIFSHSISSALSISTAATSLRSPNSCSSLSSSPSSSKPSLTSHLLTSTFHASELLTATRNGPTFIPPSVPKGISLRNFGIQVPIYATLSDIVIYSPKGLTRAAFALAERFKLAIESKAYERGMVSSRKTGSPCSISPPASLQSSPSHASSPSASQCSSPSRATPGPRLISYNVFIITDPFSTFEREFPDLVGVTSTGSPVNHISFPDRETQEMQDLTHATEIHPGVWLGNSADVPVWEQGDPDTPFEASCNPNGYDICIECHDQVHFPHNVLLKQAEDHLTALDALWTTGYAGHISPSFFGSPGAPSRPPPNANTIIHFSFPSAPPATQSTMVLLSPFLSFLQSVLHRPRRCKILIYSHDGYTESSVLALSLLMAEKRCSLPEAYLHVQVTRGRSFFVHQCDLGILKRVEAKYSRAADKEKQRDAERAGRERWGWSAIMGRSNTLGFGNNNSSTSSSSSTSPSTGAGQLSTSIPTPSLSETPHRRARAQTSPLLPALVDHQSWFNDVRFDGSFPSRVLPFLYLGNLNHASNAYMLHALGITHVVSVGECALVPPFNEEDGCSSPEYQVVFGKESGMPGSLWTEEREGRIKVLDIKGVCDDGIDSLRPTFVSICDWIDQARREGGQVLVHCRVGVSRSATVTIAYVMKHLQLSLVDAYLIVRSRRLSVLIQPNMRLLYNLCGWEVELARQRVGDDEDALRHVLKKTLNWPYLAREVHLLNEKYLH
ncbi:hypothetical protein JB92DRAFT_2712778 [Gautieria morchelliformis]|nr:hypothetical protein JB92DRAFT_2712778 [Gautieria morchelliformis]